MFSSNCSPWSRIFFSSSLVPVCVLPAQHIPPCRHLCLLVQASCIHLFPWPPTLNLQKNYLFHHIYYRLRLLRPLLSRRPLLSCHPPLSRHLCLINRILWLVHCRSIIQLCSCTQVPRPLLPYPTSQVNQFDLIHTHIPILPLVLPLIRARHLCSTVLIIGLSLTTLFILVLFLPLVLLSIRCHFFPQSTPPTANQDTVLTFWTYDFSTTSTAYTSSTASPSKRERSSYLCQHR